MKTQRLVITFLCLLLCRSGLPQTMDMDQELALLSDKLAPLIKEQGKKKVTVLDFTDLQGGSSELGRYIAEQLTVNLVMSRKDFSVLDRANLKSILAEHKLTAKGLIDPANAKELGKFSGVDALILGNIIPKSQTISLTVKIITTDTAEIVGAARAEFKTNDIIRQLESHPAIESKASDAADDTAQKPEEPKVKKSFGDLRVEIPPLRIVNGTEYQITMTLTNQNPKKSVWVALRCDNGTKIMGTITDPSGNQFMTYGSAVSGISFATYFNDLYSDFSPATEIGPNDGTVATVRFRTMRAGNFPQAGACNLQLEFLVGHDFGGGRGHVTKNNFVGEIKAN